MMIMTREQSVLLEQYIHCVVYDVAYILIKKKIHLIFALQLDEGIMRHERFATFTTINL